MSATNRLKNQHLLWRAAFGPMSENVATLDSINSKKLWDLLVQTSEQKPEKLNVSQLLIEKYYSATKEMNGRPGTDLTKEQRKEIQDLSRENLRTLNTNWLQIMVNSKSQLREKATLFWHGHFACRINNSYFQQELLDIIRQNALGSFRDILMGVSKSAAMLQFLNNQQNRKQKPNENFAREVMELFTMGRGNYTENDVKEAARAFTGWGFNAQGEFIFRKNQHDDGTKAILGKTGNFSGEDVIEILLQQKQTAKFLAGKLYRFYVNDNVDETKVKWLGERFYQSNYNIQLLLEDIFTSDWFYADKNIGTKIKSPVELMVGIRRMLPMQLENEQTQINYQRALGQQLFYPPNVAGWPGGKNWIDSSSLMLRLRIPQILTANEILDIRPKADDDVMMGQMMMAAQKKLKEITKGATAMIDWSAVNLVFEKIPRDKLLENITELVLQTKSQVSKMLLEKYVNTESRENFIKSAMVNLMATPEYQLC